MKDEKEKADAAYAELCEEIAALRRELSEHMNKEENDSISHFAKINGLHKQLVEHARARAVILTRFNELVERAGALERRFGALDERVTMTLQGITTSIDNLKDVIQKTFARVSLTLSDDRK